MSEVGEYVELTNEPNAMALTVLGKGKMHDRTSLNEVSSTARAFTSWGVGSCCCSRKRNRREFASRTTHEDTQYQAGIKGDLL